MTVIPADHAHMAAALALGDRALGDSWPNPAVGCVLVRDGVVVGRGWTQSGGRPHAEREALDRAGAAAERATAYVSLEPCSHHGNTPPCADALIAAGVKRVVAAMVDPDPRVAGQGLALLRSAGVEVSQGVGEQAARASNRGFFLRLAAGRPLFALKTATGLDSRIALASGESRWITGPAARAAGQLLRARHDAILVGSETVIVDDPMLTCRMEGYRARPKTRVVLDRRLRLKPTHQVARTARSVPTWLITGPEAAARAGPLRDCGVIVLPADSGADDAAFALAAAKRLGAEGLTRVLIEGGGRVAAAFLRAGLIDEIAWFRAPSVMGADARAAIGDLGLTAMSQIVGFRPVTSLVLGPDRIDMYQRE